MRVTVVTAKGTVKEAQGRKVEGIILTCSRCGQTVEVFGKRRVAIFMSRRNCIPSLRRSGLPRATAGHSTQHRDLGYASHSSTTPSKIGPLCATSTNR
jgi:hypothetical protein